MEGAAKRRFVQMFLHGRHSNTFANHQRHEHDKIVSDYKSTPNLHVLFPSYSRTIQQICVQQNKFDVIRFNIKIN